MTDLSLEAQAIVDAFNVGFDRPLAVHLKPRIAAVLRALANQYDFAETGVGVTEKVVLVDDILKIATELEAI